MGDKFAFNEQKISKDMNIKPETSYVKLAMRNMVRKKLTSFKHFFITTVGVISLLVALAYLTH